MAEHVKVRLTAYASGELDPGDSERIRVHLESCAECRSAYEEHARFETLLQEATLSLAPTESLWPKVAARLQAPAAFHFTFRLAGGMAFAAAIGIVVSLAIPTTTPTDAGGGDLWSTLDYGLVDGAPVALSAFDAGSTE